MPNWADKIIDRNEYKIKQILYEKGRDPDRWLPIDRPEKTELPRSIKFNPLEFGCGAYGCVYATEFPNMVFKVTTDPTEAYFVSAYIDLVKRGWTPPKGVVYYYEIFELSGEKYQQQRVYILWREEAVWLNPEWQDEITYMKYERTDSEVVARAATVETINWINFTKALASVVFNRFANMYSTGKTPAQMVKTFKAGANATPKFKTKYERAIRKFGTFPQYNMDKAYDWFEDFKYAALEKDEIPFFMYATLDFARQMSEREETQYIGEAYIELFKQNMFVTDVHTSNVGLVNRPDDPDFDPIGLVITDPGNVIPLDSFIANIQPEVI